MKSIVEYLTETIDHELNLHPNKSRKSGNTDGLVYLTSSKSYAISYANGLTSTAHAGSKIINSGLIFYVCLSENESHYGGDVWISGYKDSIVDDLVNYKNDSDYELDSLSEEFIESCGFDLPLSDGNINEILRYIQKDDLSLISPIDWSYIQTQQSGYDEICIKNLSMDKIIKIEVYKNQHLFKTIPGNYKHNCDNIYYHGSPLEYWNHLIKENNVHTF
jgi:hypothetical protein